MDVDTKIAEAGEVITWRHRQLTNAGFSVRLASTIARDPRWDLHALIELVERGCEAHVAMRILAPLDEDWDGR